MNVHIEHYLYGRVEFQMDINRDGVDASFIFSHSSSTTSSPLTLPIRPKPDATTQPRAPPLYLGMWAKQQLISSLRSEDAVAAAPPLSKGM